MRPFAKPLVQLPLFFSSLFYCGACWKASCKTLDEGVVCLYLALLNVPLNSVFMWHCSVNTLLAFTEPPSMYFRLFVSLKLFGNDIAVVYLRLKFQLKMQCSQTHFSVVAETSKF